MHGCGRRAGARSGTPRSRRLEPLGRRDAVSTGRCSRSAGARDSRRDRSRLPWGLSAAPSARRDAHPCRSAPLARGCPVVGATRRAPAPHRRRHRHGLYRGRCHQAPRSDQRLCTFAPSLAWSRDSIPLPAAISACPHRQSSNTPSIPPLWVRTIGGHAKNLVAANRVYALASDVSDRPPARRASLPLRGAL